VDAGRRTSSPTPGAWTDVAIKVVRTVGFHVLVIALFAVPAVALWWHVWSGHPANTLTCSCGDPAQEVWFVAWPAWAVTHLANPFFSHSVNVPQGANLLSNTSGPLVGIVLAPVTWLWGPVVATNVALTLAPALSAWGCFLAVRPLVTWKGAAIPAALVYGYSSAVISSLVFGHVSVTVLVVPPLLFTLLHEIVVRQEHSVRRDGLVLAALTVIQFLISPEVFVICGLLALIGSLAVVAVGWRQVRVRAGHALPALGLAALVSGVVLAYPIWFGLAGPQAVTGVLFAIAPLDGVPLSGFVAPGPYAVAGSSFVRFGGYLGRTGPPPNYLGGGLAVSAAAAVVVGRRRPLTWLLVFMTVVTAVLALGGAPRLTESSLSHHVWLPWHSLSTLPILKEILADQFAPFICLFVGFLLAVGLDALSVRHWPSGSWLASRRRTVTVATTVTVTVLSLVPVFATFDVPLSVESVRVPSYLRHVAPTLPEHSVVLTIPFAVSGSAEPMLWQAVEGMHFDLAGAALKTPGPGGGPVAQGAPGSARRILTDLTLGANPKPTGTPSQVNAVRQALGAWRVDRVVIAGRSADPVYASGFLTMVIGVAPAVEDGALVWNLQQGNAPALPALGASLALCELAADAPAARANPLFMSNCVVFSAGRG
jgi:hypothetical protein